MPSWIRSSSGSSLPWYFLAIETTRRRFELIMRSLASRSPRSIAFDSSISSSAVSSGWRRTSFRNSWRASVVAVASSPLTILVGSTSLAPAVVGELEAACLDALVGLLGLLVVELQLRDQVADVRQVHAVAPRDSADSMSLDSIVQGTFSPCTAIALPLPRTGQANTSGRMLRAVPEGGTHERVHARTRLGPNDAAEPVSSSRSTTRRSLHYDFRLEVDGVLRRGRCPRARRPTRARSGWPWRSRTTRCRGTTSRA